MLIVVVKKVLDVTLKGRDIATLLVLKIVRKRRDMRRKVLDLYGVQPWLPNHRIASLRP